MRNNRSVETLSMHPFMIGPTAEDDILVAKATSDRERSLCLICSKITESIFLRTAVRSFSTVALSSVSITGS